MKEGETRGISRGEGEDMQRGRIEEGPFKAPLWRERVEARMKELKVSRTELARALKLRSHGAIGHYFCGRRLMTVEQLQAMAKRLNWTVAQLLGERESFSIPRGEPLARVPEPGPAPVEVKAPKPEPAPAPYAGAIVLTRDELEIVLKIYRPAPQAVKPIIRRLFAKLTKEISRVQTVL
jgi:transcriptional regulator with XRE-family HTH domain